MTKADVEIPMDPDLFSTINQLSEIASRDGKMGKSKHTVDVSGDDSLVDQLDGGDDESVDNLEQPNSGTSVPATGADKPKKRKKAARACNHCQTAHLTCDDHRPCQRCVKRNLGETCQDGVRKKAKYLRDIEDEIVNAGKLHPTNFAPSATPPLKADEASPPPSHHTSVTHSQSSLLTASSSSNPFPTTSSSNLPATSNGSSLETNGFNASHDSHGSSTTLTQPPTTVSPFQFFNDFTTTGDFGSHGANLEYAVLSSMLNNAGYGSNSPHSAGPSNLPHNNAFPSINSGYGDNNMLAPNASNVQESTFGFPPAAFQDQSLAVTSNGTPHTTTSQPSLSPYRRDASSLSDLDSVTSHSTFQGKLIDHNWAPAKPTPSHPSQVSEFATQHPVAKPTVMPLVSATGVMRVEDVYKQVNKPYNYLEGYHTLIRYLQQSFKNKSDTLRIIRALSIYRPSLIALQMPLTVDDEIFVERSFQRTLIEIEKLISFSGTPTLVWRRTGEIMLVGTEFTLLSEWKREDILWSSGASLAAPAHTGGRGKEAKPRRRYIFEIFDSLSTVEYYESFAAHAFESSTSTIMSTCKIVTPSGRKVPCTFGYNLKRDIFGLPSMVIGQFLPILSGSA